MKLKALVYQQKEWNPLQLSTDFPVFPVENITEEALAVWKLHAEEVLLITPTDAGIQAILYRKIIELYEVIDIRSQEFSMDRMNRTPELKQWLTTYEYKS